MSNGGIFFKLYIEMYRAATRPPKRLLPAEARGLTERLVSLVTYLVDANVLSEPTKPTPNLRVVA